MDKKFTTRKNYDETAEKYDSRYRDIQQQKYREVFSHIDIDDTNLILDVGSGTGILLDFFSSKVDNILCCDLSLNMLYEGKKKYTNANFICTDSEHLPFRQSSIDIVTCFSVIQNLPEPTVTIDETFRVLRRGGKLILTVLDKSFSDKKLREISVKAGYEVDLLWHLSIEDLSIIAKKN